MPKLVEVLIFGFMVCNYAAANQKETVKPLKVGDEAPGYVLKDATGQPHALKKLRGKVVVLIFGNRKIQKEDDKWAHAVQTDYQGYNRVLAYIIADMRSVPRFVPKALIKRQLKKNRPPVTLLLDWKGETHKAYRTKKEMPNLYVVNPDGKIAFHIKANFGDEKYKELKAVTEVEIAKIKE